MSGGRFLQRIALSDARTLVVSLARTTDAEVVAAEASLGRTTAEAVHARFASPHYRASAMDGIAVHAEDTAAAAADSPLDLQDAGGEPAAANGPACFAVDTGNPLPDWADAVIRIEDTQRSGDTYTIKQPASPGKDVRRIGEDVAAAALLFGPGHRVRPYDIGAMLASGVESLAVRKPPQVTVLATGTEIVEPGGTPAAGQVIEFNSRMLAGCVAQWGGEARYAGHVDDDRSALEAAVRAATASSDIVCVIAGSSAGRKDYTVDVLAECGTVHAHGVDMMPGKPAAIAEVNGVPVIGVPGYPVSAFAVYRELLQPLVAACLGSTCAPVRTATATVKRRIVSRLGVEELLRVCLARSSDGLVVATLPRGAGSVTTLVRADAILRVPATCEGLDEGTEVDVELLDTGTEPGSTWVVAGYPDALTAAIESQLRRRGIALRVSYLGRAPYDMVAALAGGEAHTAVLDADDIAAVRSFRELAGTLAPDASITESGDARFIVALTRDVDALPGGAEIVRLLTQ